MTKTTRLKRAILKRKALVVPGCHDAVSARVIAAHGFQAVQVSGFGLAGSLLGAPDVGLLDMTESLDQTRRIVRAVEIPVMADADTGGGNALNAVRVTQELITMGAAGMNIEDQVFPKRCGHLAGKEVIPAEEMAGKIRACAEARDRLDSDFVINARTDARAGHGLEEAVRRGNLYLAAGADLVFIDAIHTKAEMAHAVRAVRGPLSVNLMDGVTGVKTELVPVPELARMGVARVSIPVASILVAHRALTEFFSALSQSPGGVLPGEEHRLTPFGQYLEDVGMQAYQAMEARYLPREKLAQKYEDASES